MSEPNPPITPMPGADGGSFVRITPRGAYASDTLGGVRELWAHRRILAAMVQRQLRLRYKGSALGILWSLAPPIVQVFILTVIIGKVLNSGPHNLSAFMFCAFLPWIFVSNSLLDSSFSVLENLSIVKKSYFPREFMPLAAVCANFVHFLIATVVFLIYRYGVTTLIFGWPGLPPHEIVMLPLVMLDLILLTTGLCFLLSAWTTFFEDLKYIVQNLLNILFYALPIMYFSEDIFYAGSHTSSLKHRIYDLYLANPLAWIVTAFKQMFFARQPVGTYNVPNTFPQKTVPIMMAQFDYRFFAITTVISVAVFLIGCRVFERLKWKFVERP